MHGSQQDEDRLDPVKALRPPGNSDVLGVPGRSDGAFPGDERLQALRQALHQAEHELQVVGLLYEHAAAGLVRLDADFRVIHANATFCGQLLRDAALIIGHPLASVVAGADLERLHQALRDTWERGTPRTISVRLLRADGLLFPAEIVIFHGGDFEGNSEGWLSVVDGSRHEREIRHLRQRCEASEGENRALSAVPSGPHTSALLEALPLGVMRTDADGRLVYVNDAYCDLLGYSREELLTQTIWTLSAASPEAVEKSRLYYRYLIEEQPALQTFISPKRRRDNEIIWLRIDWNYDRDADGKAVGTLGVVSDATEQHRTEEKLASYRQQLEVQLQERTEELRDSEERFALAVEGVGVGIWEWQSDRSSLYLSRQAMDIVAGHKHGVMPTMRQCLRRLTTIDRGSLLSHLRAHLQTGVPMDVTVALPQALPLDSTAALRPGGSTRWVRIRGKALWTGHDREHVRIVGALEDVTLLTQAETARLQLEHRVSEAEKLESMGRLAGMVVHDVNNILFAVRACADLATRALPEDHKAQAYLREILAASARGDDVIDRLTNARSSASNDVMHLQLGTVVHSVVAAIRPTLPEGVRLEVHAEDEDLVMGSETDLPRVVTNLCRNAIRAMAEGGVLGLSVSREDVTAGDAMVVDGRLAPGAHVALRVSDTGVGMDEETMVRAFDPFFSRSENGHGLGLLSVRTIVQGHGGAVRIASKLGSGSCFTVLLPAAPRAQ